MDSLEKIQYKILAQNINDICAVCLQQHKNHRTSSMQDMLSAQDEIKVYKVLESISLFKYSVMTSQLLCSTCSLKLLNIYEFQQMCNKSYFILNNHIKQKDTQDTYKLEIVDASNRETDIGSIPFIHEVGDNNFPQGRMAEEDIFDVISENEVSRMEDLDADDDACKIEMEDTKVHILSSDSEGSIKSIQKSSIKFQASTTELTFSEGTTKVCLESELVRAGTIEGDGITNQSTRIDHQLAPTGELTEHGAHPKGQLCSDKKESCSDARRGRITEFLCKYCNKVFGGQQVLSDHENLHTGEKPYKCDQCTRAYAWPQSLDRHKETHNSEKRFGCKLCGKTFLYKGVLTSHLESHTNARSHVCSVCNKGFNRRDYLMKHIRSHIDRDDNTTVQKSYTCNQCPKAYVTRSGLTYHKLGHTAERPFVCDICAKTFKEKASFNRHMKSHVNASHVCSMCGKDFNVKRHLMAHMRRKHNTGDNYKSKISVKKP